LGEVRIEHKPLPVDDPTRRKPDIARAIADLEWSPEVPLKEGLQRTIAEFRTRLANGTLEAR
jgi:nucleoside-diphosphate-sugar epimerase